MIKKILVIMFGILFLFNLISFVNGEEIYANEVKSQVYLEEGTYCSDGKAWIDTINRMEYPTLDSRGTVYDCRRFNEEGWEQSNSCCPSSSDCREFTGSGLRILNVPGTRTTDKYTCAVTTAKFCSDYKTKEECEVTATKAIAEYSAENRPGYSEDYCFLTESWEENGVDCQGKRLCNCIWNETADYGNGACVIDDSGMEYVLCSTRPGIDNCQYVITYDDSGCGGSTGMITVYWDAVKDSEECTDVQNSIKCSDVTKLSFFNWMNLIATVIILFVIYYLYIETNKGKREVKKKVSEVKKKNISKKKKL